MVKRSNSYWIFFLGLEQKDKFSGPSSLRFANQALNSILEQVTDSEGAPSSGHESALQMASIEKLKSNTLSWYFDGSYTIQVFTKESLQSQVDHSK